MIKENDPMIPRKDSNDENSKGVEVKMMNQREKEKKGRFVRFLKVEFDHIMGAR